MLSRLRARALASPTHLPLNPLQDRLLELGGVLRENHKHPCPRVVSEDAIDLFAAIARAGEPGLLLTRIPRRLKAGWADLVVELELMDLVQRTRNTRGQIAYLTLTWKGYEALQQAREHSNQIAHRKRVGGLGARRRAEISKNSAQAQENASVPWWKEALS